MSCITLLSDLGVTDASVASAKGILLQYIPKLPVIDISHSIEPFHVQQAAYILRSAYGNFPQNTVHLVLFDVFSETEPRLVLCEKEGQYFFAPDNGFLTLAFNSGYDAVWQCFKLGREQSFADWLHRAAAIIKRLQSQKPDTLGFERCELNNVTQKLMPIIEKDTVECHVIHIDRFENVVLNISQEMFEKARGGRRFRIRFMRDEEINTISLRYSEEKEGEKLCRFNAAGFLEIAINRGKAASLLGLRLHQKKHLIYSTIKIFFE